MARPRKSGMAGTNSGNDSNKQNKSNRSGETNSTSSSTTNGGHQNHSGGKHPKEGNRFFAMTKWRALLGCCCLAIASYFGYIGYLETRINTPFDDQKMVHRSGLDDPDRYWGSYRPGVYFGMKTRDPQSLVMGLMWFSPNRLRTGGEGIRHWCETGDQLDQFGWLKHDGRTFGLQTIDDFPYHLQTSFIKTAGGQFGGDWTARINATAQSGEEISLIWYTAFDEKTNGYMRVIEPSGDQKFAGVQGETVGLGEFRLNLIPYNGTTVHQSYISATSPNLASLRQIITSNLHIGGRKGGQRIFVLPGDTVVGDRTTNFIATLITVKVPFILDISYQSTNSLRTDSTVPMKPLLGKEYSVRLIEKSNEFDKRFEETFHLSEKGYSKSDIKFAEAALSNMIGGLGYFYGSSKVQSVHTKEPVPYWRAPLYTAVPSRSFFPRGFLWDEGFHGLLISAWDIDIELDILSHWFDLMNVEGWIPREQILGVEALAKVPDEFVTQRNTNANPPTFFLTLKSILNRYSHSLLTKGRLAVLERLYPRLQTWLNWYNTTQRGDLPGTYRWRGRDPETNRELNPKTLTSGLDDYPRSSHPTESERHIDLRCWIAFAAGVMADLADLLGHDDSKYWETHYYLSDNYLLNEMHLSPFTESYSDWGLHTDSVILKRFPIKQTVSVTNPYYQEEQQTEMVRVTLKNPEPRFIDSTFGYVSLFPFFLEILTTDSPYLGKTLQNLRDPNQLWTEFGIRSLSKMSPLYMKRNTEHDPPYWRGQIWINMNYLTLKALYHYGSQPGPFSEDAKRIYVELRHNLVRNVIQQYHRTGYIWEQYNDRTGSGSGCKPFTGWSALVVLIMSEQY